MATFCKSKLPNGIEPAHDQSDSLNSAKVVTTPTPRKSSDAPQPASQNLVHLPKLLYTWYDRASSAISEVAESHFDLFIPSDLLNLIVIFTQNPTTCTWDPQSSNQRFRIDQTDRSLIRLEPFKHQCPNRSGTAQSLHPNDSPSEQRSPYDAFDASQTRHERDPYVVRFLSNLSTFDNSQPPSTRQRSNSDPTSCTDVPVTLRPTRISLSLRERAFSEDRSNSKSAAKKCVARSSQVFRAGARYRITCIFRRTHNGSPDEPLSNKACPDPDSLANTFVSLTSPPFFYSTRVVGFVRVSDTEGEHGTHSTSPPAWPRGRQPRTMYQRTLRQIARDDEGKCYWVFDLLHSAWMRKVSGSSHNPISNTRPQSHFKTVTDCLSPIRSGARTTKQIIASSTTRLALNDNSSDQIADASSKADTGPPKGRKDSAPSLPKGNSWNHGDVFTLELDFSEEALNRPCTPRDHGTLNYIYNGESYPGFLPAIKPPVKFALATCTPGDEFHLLQVVEF